MDIFVAAGIAGLSIESDVQRTKTQIKAAVDGDARALMVSDRFFKITLPTNKLASPIHGSSEGPIVAELNIRKIGKLSNGFVPKIIVISGQKTFRKAHAIQAARIEVWIGERALKKLGLHVEDVLSDHQFVPMQRAGSPLEAASIMAHCGMTVMKDSEEHDVMAAYRDFKSAVKRGYKPKIEAVSPPGWKSTTEKMKEHPEIDNPWALAWWMKDQGYQSHEPDVEKGDKKK